MFDNYYLTLDDFDVKGKRVLLRTDINSEVTDGKVIMNDKIEKHAETMKELSERKAKIVALSHQGRVGRKDFVTLEQHASLLRNYGDVKYVDDIIGPTARESVKELKEGEILLLENVRMLAEETLKRSPEEHSKSIFIRKLAPLMDIYINDGFETAHRSHASLVGFPYVLPAGIGRLLEKELESLKKVIEDIRRPSVYVLGGVKFDEILLLIEHLLEKNKADYIIATGDLTNLFLCVRGVIDERNFDEKYVNAAKRVMDENGEERIKLPKDVAIEVKGERKEIPVEDIKPSQAVYDIGMETCEEYSKLLEKARAIVMKGPAGVYEKKGFIDGTKRIFEAIANSKAFSIIAGGNTTSALKASGISKNKFSHVSLAGGALLKYLMEERLPALEVLRRE